MEKKLRCTVCAWRGEWSDAAFAPRVRQSDLPPSLESIQAVYEEQQSAGIVLGQAHPPPCPTCGHHTVVVARRVSFHPAM
jgi:hypothetical protein